MYSYSVAYSVLKQFSGRYI